MNPSIPDYVKCDIYKATHTGSNKPYIGQAKTHYRKGNTGWIPAGYLIRWRCHISEAFAKYDNESAKLNNYIRKYGVDSFRIELIETCSLADANEREIYHIAQNDSVHNGLNIRAGGQGGILDKESRKALSQTLVKLNDENRVDMMTGMDLISVKINEIKSTHCTVISLCFRLPDGKSIKLDFGGVQQDIETSLTRAVDFATKIMPDDAIVVQRCLADRLKDRNFKSDDRLQANSKSQQKSVEKRLEKLKDLEIKEIRIERISSKGTQMCRLNIVHKTGKKYVTFGGKLVHIDESIRNATELAQRLAPEKIRN